MMKTKGICSLLVAVMASAPNARGQDTSVVSWLSKAALLASIPKPAIILVDGPNADAMSWQYVIPILETDGYNVIAVETSLSSLAEDITTTRRVIRSQLGRVVVVGHSYGGAVITGAAAAPNVKALVYLAAFAPDVNEPVGAFNDKYPSASSAAMLINAATLSETISFPAWRTIPSWYLVMQDDRAINPALQRFFAKRMRAATSEVKASQVAFISRPKTVARLIEDAAAVTEK
jgi:pimeloyl-ACP methyl ester carboxylesterase